MVQNMYKLQPKHPKQLINIIRQSLHLLYKKMSSFSFWLFGMEAHFHLRVNKIVVTAILYLPVVTLYHKCDFICHDATLNLAIVIFLSTVAILYFPIVTLSHKVTKFHSCDFFLLHLQLYISQL